MAETVDCKIVALRLAVEAAVDKAEHGANHVGQLQIGDKNIFIPAGEHGLVLDAQKLTLIGHQL